MSALLRGFLRDVSGPLLVAVVYLGLRLAFSAMTEDDGLLTPESAPDLEVAALGLVVLLVRLAVIFLLPAVVVSRFVARLIRHKTPKDPRRVSGLLR